MPNDDLVVVDHLTYEYPGHRALSDLSLRIRRGSITALVGPNGAGKSTLMRCMAALDNPIEGSIHIDGIDIFENPRECHRQIGYLSDFFGLYDTLTVAQSLKYTALSHGLSEHESSEIVDKVADRLHLNEKMDVRCKELSRGQRQRVAIAHATTHSPSLLILDEPASGLDPEARHELAQVFKDLRQQGMTLLVSSHILAELDDYSTDMLVIRNGRIIESRQLNHAATGVITEMCVEFAEHPMVTNAAIVAAIADLADSNLIDLSQGLALIRLPADSATRTRLIRAVVEAGLPVVAAYEYRENLQDSYLKTVTANHEGEGK